MLGWLLLLLVAVALGLGFFVGLLNPQTVPVDLFFAEYTLPLGALMLLCVITGIVATALLGMISGAVRRMRRGHRS